MQIEVEGRNVAITDEVREMVERRFSKVARQVSDLAILQIELCEERNPANPISQVAEATLHLKGVTLRARDAARDMQHAINLVADDIARQVKRHRDKRRWPRAGSGTAEPPPGVETLPAAPMDGSDAYAEAV
jgi:ribosome hibernation promoting factor